MIQLRLQRRTLRESGIPKGPNHNFYRVLCIAMLNERDKDTVYTADNIASHGVDSENTPGLFEMVSHKIKKWAYHKDMNVSSDLVDEDDEPLSPYGWTRENWIKGVPVNVYNKAVKVINDACDMHENDGTAGDTYWFSQACGLIRVHAPQYEEHIKRINEAYAIIKHKDELEGEAFRKVGLPLSSLQAAQPGLKSSVTANKWSIFGRNRWIAFAAVIGIFATVGVASYQVDFWDVLRKEGVSAAKKYNEQLPAKDQALVLYREAVLALREGEHGKAKENLFILLGNPDYENHWGNCYYLMALLESTDGQYESALDYFLKARNFAELKNTLSLLPFVHYGLARCYLFLKDWEKFDASLSLLPQSKEAQYLHISAWGILIRNANYEEAIMTAQASIHEYEKQGNENLAMIAYADLAIFHSLNGEIEQALSSLSVIDDYLMSKQPDNMENIFFYTKIAKFTLAKCMGWSSMEKHKERIQEFAHSYQKGEYTLVLETIEDLQCRREK
jgi:tetratricopeptide (TPR) repeat protein